MSKPISVLIACENFWLLYSTQALLQDVAFIDRVTTCSIKLVRAAADRCRPDVILVLNGSTFVAHYDILTRLRSDQPEALIIMTTAIEETHYERHPFTANFDALISEARLSHALIPTIHDLIRSFKED